MEALIKEQQKTNELLQQIIKQNKNPYELLTVEQVHQEVDIGINMVRKIFKDPALEVQRYTTPFKVARKAINEYLTQNHDYLSERR